MAWVTQVLFPEGIISLQQELATGLHPKLYEILSKFNFKPDDWELILSQVAMYCGVILDGTYGEEEISKLGFILAGRLEVLRELPAPQVVIALH